MVDAITQRLSELSKEQPSRKTEFESYKKEYETKVKKKSSSSKNKDAIQIRIDEIKSTGQADTELLSKEYEYARLKAGGTGSLSSSEQIAQQQYVKSASAEQSLIKKSQTPDAIQTRMGELVSSGKIPLNKETAGYAFSYARTRLGRSGVLSPEEKSAKGEFTYELLKDKDVLSATKSPLLERETRYTYYNPKTRAEVINATPEAYPYLVAFKEQKAFNESFTGKFLNVYQPLEEKGRNLVAPAWTYLESKGITPDIIGERVSSVVFPKPERFQETIEFISKYNPTNKFGEQVVNPEFLSKAKKFGTDVRPFVKGQVSEYFETFRDYPVKQTTLFGVSATATYFLGGAQLAGSKILPKIIGTTGTKIAGYSAKTALYSGGILLGGMYASKVYSEFSLAQGAEAKGRVIGKTGAELTVIGAGSYLGSKALQATGSYIAKRNFEIDYKRMGARYRTRKGLDDSGIRYEDVLRYKRDGYDVTIKTTPETITTTISKGSKKIKVLQEPNKILTSNKPSLQISEFNEVIHPSRYEFIKKQTGNIDYTIIDSKNLLLKPFSVTVTQTKEQFLLTTTGKITTAPKTVRGYLVEATPKGMQLTEDFNFVIEPSYKVTTKNYGLPLTEKLVYDYTSLVEGKNILPPLKNVPVYGEALIIPSRIKTSEIIQTYAGSGIFKVQTKILPWGKKAQVSLFGESELVKDTVYVTIPKTRFTLPSSQFSNIEGFIAGQSAKGTGALGIVAGLGSANILKNVQTERTQPAIKSIIEQKPSVIPSLKPEIKPSLQPRLKPETKPKIEQVLSPRSITGSASITGGNIINPIIPTPTPPSPTPTPIPLPVVPEPITPTPLADSFSLFSRSTKRGKGTARKGKVKSQTRYEPSLRAQLGFKFPDSKKFARMGELTGVTPRPFKMKW